MFWLYLIGGVTLINSLYYLLFTKIVFWKSNNQPQGDSYPISLLICAKNEAENLQRHIPLWQAQTYSDLEIILINDASTDATLEIMESFAKTDSRIKVVDVENNEAFWGNKKYALTLGIKRAKNRRMIFTDADCQPASNQWITEMAACFSEEKQLILGYGGYLRSSGILNRLIRFETVMTAVQYVSYALAGIPYMGVGRNMGYTSNLYYDNNGFMSHIQVPSGDDDLFVNEAGNRKNTAICLAKEAFTYSIPKKTYAAWIHQKRRHITTSQLYKPKHKFLLGTYYLSILLFWVLLPFVFVFGDWTIVLGIVAFRFLLQYIVVGSAASKLNERSLIPGIPLWELFLVLVQMTIFISNTVSRPTHWK